MAKKVQKKKTTARGKKKKEQTRSTVFMVTGLILLLCGFFGLAQLGFLGTLLANVFRIISGNAYYVIAGLFMLYGILLLIYGHEPHLERKSSYVGFFTAYVGVLLLLHAVQFQSLQASGTDYLGLTWQSLKADIISGTTVQPVGGGMIGALLYSGIHFLFDQVGSYILAVLLITAGLFVLFGIKWREIAEKLQQLIHWFQEGNQRRRAAREEKDAERAKLAAEQAAKEEEAIRQRATERMLKDQEGLAFSQEEVMTTEAADLSEEIILPPIEPVQLKLEIDGYPNGPHTTEQKVSEPVPASEDELDFDINQELEDQDYVLPPADLLNDIQATDQSAEYQTIEQNVGVLERTFKSFGVDVKVVKASLGPAVTKFEIQPAVGVKVSKVVSLTDDIALALAAKDVRIEAPIPGKSLIGIEVPNQTVSTVSFRDIIEGQPAHPDHLLEVPLGRDLSGNIITADLAKMPHLLVAGSTGSGKSVCINGIITSILMQAKPHEVKLMMVDPKMVELNVYNGIPHLLTPVVTNPRKAAQALHKVVEEMEKRYEKFAATGARNITGYNDWVRRNNIETNEARPILPFIVVIVDELADLMMVASNDVEDAITRLAQMARAAGIHMILATQRPSVDVITGIIKANVPSRIAFAVSSGTDSRTIIDSNGAEKLLGRGDMLFLPMGQNKPIRVQGAFISDEEVERVVTFVKEQQEAEYVESMMPADDPVATSGEALDDLYQEALELVVEMQTASVSLLQRRFRVGYNRAGRMIDQLEANGVIGPSEGSKPRKVLLQTIQTEIPAANEEIAPVPFPEQSEAREEPKD